MLRINIQSCTLQAGKSAITGQRLEAGASNCHRKPVDGLEQCFPNFNESPWDLVKMKIPIKRPGWRLRISNKLPGDADAAGPQTTL